MRILIVTLGSHGDVHPFIALARALADAGHTPAILTNPHFSGVIQAAGVECLPISEDLDIKDLIASKPVMHHSRGPMVVMREMMLPIVPEVYQRTLESLRDFRADVCVTHPICLGASWACERAGVPCDVAALAPSIWFTPGDRLVMAWWQSPEPGPLLSRLECFAARIIMRHALDGGLNNARRDLGLPPLRDGFFREALGGRHNLGLWSPHFRAMLPGDPPTGQICGFPWHDTVREHDPEWERIERFLGEGEAPIVFTLGTAAVHAAGDFYEQAVRATGELKRRAILLVGRPEYLPRDLPPGIAAFTYAPFSKILPRGAASVHHAGIGTTAQVLRSGRPSVPVPFAHDQFDNAARLHRLGVARIAKRGRHLGPRLAEALRAVLDDPSVTQRAGALGAKIALEDGAAVAARIITGPR